MPSRDACVGPTTKTTADPPIIVQLATTPTRQESILRAPLKYNYTTGIAYDILSANFTDTFTSNNGAKGVCTNIVYYCDLPICV